MGGRTPRCGDSLESASEGSRRGSRVLVVAWFAAACWIGLCDWALLPALARPERLTTELSLLLALIGVVLPPAAGAALVLWLGARVRQRLLGRTSTWIVASALGLLSGPYAYAVARAAFSGPQIAVHPLRVPLMVALVCSVMAGIALLAALALSERALGQRLRWIVGASLVGASAAVLTASQAWRPDEYLELHRLAGLSALLAAGTGFHQWLRETDSTLLRWKPLPVLLAISSTGWALGAATFPPRSPALAWIVWSETVFARYVTTPWSPTWPTVAPGEPSEDAGGDEPAPALARAYRDAASKRPAPHIVIFTIDNVSANRVGAYGYDEHPTTPNIDAMAERGVLFEHAHAVFPQTRYFLSAWLLGRYIGRFTKHVMPSSYKPLAFTRILKQERNYRIFTLGYFETSQHRSFRGAQYAMDEFVHPNRRPKHLRQDINGLLERISAHAEAAVQEEQPLLVWVHLVRPHLQTTESYDFDASPEFPFGDDNDALYDSAIAASDAVLPRVREIVEGMDDGRGVVWVFGSDHGAGMQRYEGKATKTLYSDHTHVPLILVAPGIEPRRVSRPVEAPLDITPTLLELVGLEPPPEYHGRSLLPDMLGLDVEDHPVVLGYNRRRVSQDEPPEWWAVVQRPWKLVRRKHQLLLTNYEEDPDELDNLVEEHPDVAQQLDRTAGEILVPRLIEFHEALDRDGVSTP